MDWMVDWTGEVKQGRNTKSLLVFTVGISNKNDLGEWRRYQFVSDFASACAAVNFVIPFPDHQLGDLGEERSAKQYLQKLCKTEAEETSQG